MTHKRTNAMAQWISIEEAAVKYGFEAEYLWVLIEMREIIVDYQRPDVDFIDDRSIQDFVERNRLGLHRCISINWNDYA